MEVIFKNELDHNQPKIVDYNKRISRKAKGNV